MNPKAFEKIETYFNKRAAKEKCAGFAATVQIGGNTKQFTGGSLSLNDPQTVKNDTLFEIGSLSKPITAAIVYELAKQNQIDISKSIYYYLSRHYEVSPLFEFIIIKEVLIHRSGLPRVPHAFLQKIGTHPDPYSVITKGDLADFLKSPTELNQPGKFNYSNLGYALLAEILSIITNKSFAEVANEFLFLPLGMTHTGKLEKFHGDDNKATGYDAFGKQAPYWTGFMLDGAGSIMSTNTDMLLFLEHARRMDNPLAWAWQIKNGFVSKILGYRGFIWHNGMTGGFGSYMAFHPDRNASMFVVVNKAVILDHWFYYFTSYTR